jgi:DNA-binding IclR family transcriptional regulator
MSRKADGAPAVDAPATGVAAVDRALAILAVFEHATGPLTLGDIARGAALYKSTALRLLASLVRHRLVVRLHDGRYQVGPAVYRLGSRFERTLRIEEHASPILQKLAALTGESVALYARQGEHRLCLLRVESARSIRHTINVGELRPLSIGASGSILLHFANGSAETPVAAFAELPAMVLGTQDPELAGMAMPIFGIGDTLVCALSISGPMTRFDAEFLASSTRLIIAAATELTARLGGDPIVFEALRNGGADWVQLTHA